MSVSANCVHHPWQPALNPCIRCGDFVCVRCAEQRPDVPGSVVCLGCVGQLGTAPEALPFDQEGPWLESLHATSRRVLREPTRTFSRLSEGPFDPAWRFAWGWAFLANLALMALQTDVGKLVFSPVTSALWATLSTVGHATAHYLLVLGLGGTARWKLSARAVGYAAPWLVLANLSWSFLSLVGIPLGAVVLASMLTAEGFLCRCLYLVGRHRQGLSMTRAALAAGVGSFVPVLLLLGFAVQKGVMLKNLW